MLIFRFFFFSSLCKKIDTRIQPTCGDPNGFQAKGYAKGNSFAAPFPMAMESNSELPMYYEKLIR